MSKWVYIGEGSEGWVVKGEFTKGKIYEFDLDILSLSDYPVSCSWATRVISDDGKSCAIRSLDKCFISLEEHRNNKLEEILDG